MTSRSQNVRQAILPPDPAPLRDRSKSVRKVEDTDVVIIGAGIIGLVGGLQLAKRGLEVSLIDDIAYQTPRYKVGESLLIFGNMFLRTIGELDPFLQKSYPKKGVWFVEGMEGETSFENSSEWALERTIPQRWKEEFTNAKFFRTLVEDVQIVRPEAEEKLHETVRSHSRVNFIDTARVRDTVIRGDRSKHDVIWHCHQRNQTRLTQCDWILDCSGRNRFLARQRGHDEEKPELDDDFQTASAWAQFSGVTEEKFGEVWNYQFEDGTEVKRHGCTVHLWGSGYWVWVIPLAGDRLSVGVTYDHRSAPPGEHYRRKFWNVVSRYPIFDELISEENMLAFQSYGNVQYLTDIHISKKRYGIVGDAASIIGAYYSQGISLALVAAWHFCNVVEKDLRFGQLDRKYIDRVNRATYQDWLIMRNMVKEKYTSAIQDGRFFFLSHLLDMVLIQAVGFVRHQLARWLEDTGGDTAKEKYIHELMRENLERNLFYSRSGFWGWFGEERVQRLQAYLQEQMAGRARWRVENHATATKIRCVFRFAAKMIKIWRLPFATKEAVNDISPEEIQWEPKWMRLSGEEVRPYMLKVAYVAISFIFVVLYSYDWIATFFRKIYMWVTRLLTTRQKF